MAAGVLVGFCAPRLAALAKPLLVPTLLIPLTLALVRLDWSALASLRRRPALLAALVAFMLGVSPMLVWAITTPALSVGLPATLREALMLMAASSPIVSNVALALILGVDAPLAAVVVVASTALGAVDAACARACAAGPRAGDQSLGHSWCASSRWSAVRFASRVSSGGSCRKPRSSRGATPSTG